MLTYPSCQLVQTFRAAINNCLINFTRRQNWGGQELLLLGCSHCRQLPPDASLLTLVSSSPIHDSFLVHPFEAGISVLSPFPLLMLMLFLVLVGIVFLFPFLPFLLMIFPFLHRTSCVFLLDQSFLFLSLQLLFFIPQMLCHPAPLGHSRQPRRDIL